MSRCLFAAASVFALLGGGAAEAQNAETWNAGAVDSIVVVGSRAPGRLAVDSAAPVDVISAQTLRNQGFTDINRALEFLAASFNFPHADTAPSAANTRAASLRGLSPDEVLVLVNGKRWHASSVVNFNAVFGRGSAPTDLGAIPLSAVARIEILRDGAAAQYGSDAIAGVINIVLRSDLGGSASVQGGVTSRGDGQNGTATLSDGFALGDRGRIDLTGEVRYRDSTNRAAIDSRFNRITTEQGDPDSLDLNVAANASYDLGGAQAYGDAIYDHRKSVSPAQYRAPTVAPAVYPLGFIPHIRLDLDDVGGSAGLKGAASGWAWDISDTLGYNKSVFEAHGTTNTFLAASPTAFHAGGADYLQNVVDLTLSRPIAVLAGANLAIGAEQRYEHFAIQSGEPLSFAGAGAQGFPGYNPPSPVHISRTNEAVFVDGELKPFAQLTLGAAARYEHYSDFGDATSGKLSAIYHPANMLAVRGTVSTGFRAPSLQQQGFATVTSQSSNGVLVNIGTFAVNDPVSRALGASPLKAETSKNFSGGLVLTPGSGFTFTADVFRINIANRIGLSENLGGAAVAAILKAAAITSASQVRFFTNAADTTTNGFELTANWRGRLGPDAHYDLTAGYASTTTAIDRIRPNPVLPTLPLLATASIDLLTSALPRTKATLGGRLDWRNWTLGADIADFGSFRAIQVVGEQTYNPVTTVDLNLDYAVTPTIKVGLGVLNVGDVFPDKIADRALTQGGGLQYPEVGGIGTNGREYYLRVTSRF